MSTLLHQYIFRLIREERDRDPGRFEELRTQAVRAKGQGADSPPIEYQLVPHTSMAQSEQETGSSRDTARKRRKR